MQSLVLVVAAPVHSAVPSRVQVVLPEDISVDKVRSALRSPLPASTMPPIEGELLSYVLNNGDRPPTPCFVALYSIKRDTLTVQDQATGRLLTFRTRDGKSHELPFSGEVSDFRELLGWCQAGSRYVICSQVGDESATPTSVRFLVNVTWIGKFPRGDRPSSPLIVDAKSEGDSSTST